MCNESECEHLQEYLETKHVRSSDNTWKNKRNGVGASDIGTRTEDFYQ